MGKIMGALDLSFEHSDKFLLALGRLVADSALLEMQIDWAIWYLIGSDQRSAQITTADLDFRRKISLLLALAKHKIDVEEIRDSIVEQVRGYHEMYNERNDYLHGMWAPSATNQQRGLIRTSAKGEFKFSVSDVPVSKIVDLAERFNVSALQLRETVFRLLMK